MEKILFAHRGMSSIAPENTLSAFAQCQAYGVKWFECDLDILKDGTVVISHDNDLDRCTNKSGSLSQLTADDLRSISAGSWFSDKFINEPLPTLNSVIDLINQLELNVNFELKSYSSNPKTATLLIDNFLHAIPKLDPNREIIISSFDPNMLMLLKEKCPELPVACLFDSNSIHQDWLTTMKNCQARYIHPQNDGLTKEMISEFLKYGYKINVWTVNDLARANQLFNWGVTGIFTDIAQNFPNHYRR